MADNRHLMISNDCKIFADPAMAGLSQRDAERRDIISALVLRIMKTATAGALSP
jgi:hypothetical protein